MVCQITVYFQGVKQEVIKHAISNVGYTIGCILCLFLFISTPVFSQKSTKTENLESSLKLENKPEQKLILLLSLSDELVDENPDKSLSYANAALSIAETTGDQEKQLRSLCQIAQLYLNKGDIKQAMTYGQQAVDLAEKHKSKEELFKAHMIIGYVYDAVGNYDQSTESFFFCLKISEQLKDPKKRFRMNGIGYSNFNLNNYTKALEYYQKALSICREIKDTLGISCELNNISAVYGSLNDTQFIERYVREAIAINLKMNEQFEVG